MEGVVLDESLNMTLRASGESVLSPSQSTGVGEGVVLDEMALGITVFYDLVGFVLLYFTPGCVKLLQR